MKLVSSLTSIILEASKKKVLMDKVGLSEEQADYIEGKAGSLSVWLVIKIIDKYISEGRTKESIIEQINNPPGLRRMDNSISSIMDWIRVGLNSDVKDFKNLSFDELRDASKEWHDSLNVKQGDINYVEENPILIDFRDEDGNGFYWANLQTNNSDEECERMGHCARTGRGTLYSLREVKPINQKFKLNKSHLTASINEDNGIIYQLKGPKNSKPKEVFHKYIVPLFYLIDEDGKPFIKGFGSEYESDLDFKIFDLPLDSVKEIYNKRPDLFNTLRDKIKLKDLKIIDLPNISFKKTIHLDPTEIDDVINTESYSNDIIYSILNFEFQDYYEIDNKDVMTYLNYASSTKVDDKIKELIKQANPEYDPENAEDTLYESLENYEMEDLINYIRWGMSSAYQDIHNQAALERLRNKLGDFGNVLELTDTGAVIDVDLEDLIDVYDDDVMEYIEMYTDLEGDIDIVRLLKELVYQGYIKKPRLDFDYFYPTTSDETIDEYVYDSIVDNT